MSSLVGGIFTKQDRLAMSSLDQRLKRGQVIGANIANAETPGYRALGYDFEQQLQAKSNLEDGVRMRVSNPRHLKNSFTKADGTITPDVYVRPTESVGEDGNTVDVDVEMANMAQNQILYRTATELINRKVGMLRYAINGGR